MAARRCQSHLRIGEAPVPLHGSCSTERKKLKLRNTDCVKTCDKGSSVSVVTRLQAGRQEFDS
jgi:hypothetical protein